MQYHNHENLRAAHDLISLHENKNAELARTKKASPDPFPSSRVGSGDETKFKHSTDKTTDFCLTNEFSLLSLYGLVSHAHDFRHQALLYFKVLYCRAGKGAENNQG